MKKKVYTWSIIKIIFIGIYLEGVLKIDEPYKIFCAIIAILIIGNDLIRIKLENRWFRVISKVLSLCLVLIAGSFYLGNIESYVFIVGIEAMWSEKGIKKGIVGLASFITYAILVIGTMSNTQNILNNSIDTMAPFLLGMILTYFGSKRAIDRRKIRNLNTDLKKQNEQLKEYAKEVESLTIEKERNRVAGELHDSLGHYLMGIRMHLQIIEKTKDDEKREIVLKKTKDLVDESIKELRETVFKLREKEINFKEEVEKLIKNTTYEDYIKFNLDLDNVDFLNFKIKETLYKNIKEGITNGLKHGKASRFSISLKIEEEFVILKIYNNGKSPKEIVDSNGVQGMKERVENLNGSIKFNILNSGFLVISKIPI